MYFNDNILFEISSYLNREQFFYFNSIIKSDGGNIKRIIFDNATQISPSHYQYQYILVSRLIYEYIDNVNVIDGKKLSEDQHGKMISNYINFLLEGKTVIYNKNGFIREERIYKNGYLNGRLNTYNNGKIRASVNYINNLKEGIQFFYNEDGSIEKSVTFKTGVLYGEVIIYHPNRVKKIITEIFGESFNGKFLTFYKNGNKKIVAHVSGPDYNIFHGKYQEFYKNGNLKIELYFANGIIKEGPIQYNKEGRIEMRRNNFSVEIDDEDIDFLGEILAYVEI